MDFLLGEFLQLEQFHQDFQEQKLVTGVHSVRRTRVEVVLLHYRLKHPHLLELLLQLQRQTRVVLLDCLQNVQNKLIDLHFKSRVLVKEVRKS